MRAKHLFITLLLALCGLTVAAQDIIITTGSERIEAQITEVSDEAVRYKKANNPNGPTFVIKMENIATIIYQNGDVQAIDHNANPSSSQNGYNTQANMPASIAPSTQNGSMVVVPQVAGMEAAYDVNGNLYTYPNFQTWLKMNSEWERRYKNASAMANVGGGFVGGGLGLMLGSLFWLSSKSMPYTVMAGALLATAGTPLMIVGLVKSNNIERYYRKQYNLSLQAGPNGVGLALNF